jgi:fucose 4-O-acetylase-like acetyltransferase
LFKVDKSTPPAVGLAADRPSGRVDWVDLARGVGILLVIVGHACGGIIDSQAEAREPAVNTIYLGIYSFHMAMFFLLSGLFVAQRLQSDAQSFLARSGTRIARAYFTWATIQFTVIYLMGSALNHPVDGPYLPQLVSIIWHPVSQFWFLYVLAFMQVFAFVLVPRLGATGFFVATAAVTGIFHLVSALHTSWQTLTQFCTYFVWFGAGVAVGPYLSQLTFLNAAKPVYALAAAVVWAGLFYLNYRYFDGLHPPGIGTMYSTSLYNISLNPLFLPTAMAGTAAVTLMCCSGLFSATGFIDYLGRHSMAIFLTHILFIAGSRIVLLKLMPTIHPLLLMVVISLAGLCGSLLVLYVAKRLNIARALALV